MSKDTIDVKRMCELVLECDDTPERAAVLSNLTAVHREHDSNGAAILEYPACAYTRQVDIDADIADLKRRDEARRAAEEA